MIYPNLKKFSLFGFEIFTRFTNKIIVSGVSLDECICSNCHVITLAINFFGNLMDCHCIRGVATCTHGRTCVPEKMLDLFVAHEHRKKNIQKIISEFTGKNDRTLFLCLLKQLSNLLSLHSYTFCLVCLM